MAGLGLLVAWAGYLVANFGYYMVKGTPVGIVDLALPSHRAQAMAKAHPQRVRVPGH